MEDYRKIAIELGQTLISKAPETREDVERILPELKESEDERIRKQLIEHTKWSYDEQEISEEEKERWVSWLEKQGEQKPTWSEKDEEYFDDIVRTLRSFVITGGSEAKRYTEEEINWLKSIKERVQPQNRWKPTKKMLEALGRVIPENVMKISEDEMLLSELYQGLKYGRVLSKD